MIPELGHFALIVALVIAVLQSVIPLIGAHKNDAAMIAMARPAALAQLLFVGIAYAALTHALSCTIFPCCMSRGIPIWCSRCCTAFRAFGVRMKARCCCGR